MEGLRELRGRVVFPAEEITRTPGLHETYTLRRLRGQDKLRVTTRDYARLRPEGPRLREHSRSFTVIIALSCRKSRCSCEDPLYFTVLVPYLVPHWVFPRNYNVHSIFTEKNCHVQACVFKAYDQQRLGKKTP